MTFRSYAKKSGPVHRHGVAYPMCLLMRATGTGTATDFRPLRPVRPGTNYIERNIPETSPLLHVFIADELDAELASVSQTVHLELPLGNKQKISPSLPNLVLLPNPQFQILTDYLFGWILFMSKCNAPLELQLQPTRNRFFLD